MAYERKRARQEDVNAGSRTQAPQSPHATAPTAPVVSNPGGGAPRYAGGNPEFEELQQTLPNPTAISTPEWYEPTPIKKQPWEQNPVMPPTQATAVQNPKWTLKDVADNEGAFVNEFKTKLWEKYQNASEGERNSLFFQGIKQNPELAAATFVRRALQNMADANAWINGEKPPTLNQAMQNTLANNDTRKWLEWVKSGATKPPRRY